MTHPHDLSLTPLARRALLPLPGGVGKAVGVFSGSVWITEEGDADDHVLVAGESKALRRPGLVLVEALQDSQLILFETDASAADGSADVPSTSGAARAARTGAVDAAAPRRRTLDELEREARALRRQAIGQTVSWLVRRVGQALTRTIKALTRPATLPPALPRPPGPPLAWQARR